MFLGSFKLVLVWVPIGKIGLVLVRVLGCSEGERGGNVVKTNVLLSIPSWLKFRCANGGIIDTTAKGVGSIGGLAGSG
eukprot:1160041-Pelagomonas_calceolata.AAC.10